MDTNLLISQAKARFSHNAAKAALQEKYNAKLIIAEQGGLWKADKETINFLYHLRLIQAEVVLMDTFNNPVKVNTLELYQKLFEVYNRVMNEWYDEYIQLETKK